MNAAGSEAYSSEENSGACRPAVILLVEDEKFVRDVAAEILRSAGHKVWTARTASDAIKVFHRSKDAIDLLVTDVVLPGKNGWGLSEELAAESPGMRSIFISGYPDKGRNGVTGDCIYLAKPFSVDSLMATVREALQRPAGTVKPLVKVAACSG